jgi:hypothetical protein
MAEEQKVEKTTPAETQAPAAETPAEQNYDLTVQDLSALKAIIDVAAQRGSFKPNEMQAIGTVYNKLSGFLDAVGKQGGKSNG